MADATTKAAFKNVCDALRDAWKGDQNWKADKDFLWLEKRANQLYAQVRAADETEPLFIHKDGIGIITFLDGVCHPEHGW